MSTNVPQRKSENKSILLQTILPVIVTQKGTSKSVKTYAFYDNGSCGYFLSENLKDRLKATNTKTQLQLGTMHGQSVVDSAVVEELIVSYPNGTNPIELSRTYTTNEIPVQHEQITTSREIVGRIDHLKEIAGEIPLDDQELDTGLLIGNNCPIALVPLKVVPNEGDGPFAVRLHHGWTVSGPVHIVTTPITKKKITANRVTVREIENVKEISTPESLLQLFELHFNDMVSRNFPEDLSYSQEDRRFMTKVSDGIKHTGCHYEIPPPFRQTEVQLPNNRQQAFKRALWQRKRMLQNQQYRSDYVAFITDMIDKGYAEKVPHESLKNIPDKIWYLPHHGVYHPEKPKKIRVVFDSSARYGGTSLNERLLQGPDMTNSLVGVLTRYRQEPVAFMADIEAMFYQVRAPADQLDFLRFLWWPDGDLSAELEEYQIRVHPFGAVSSPSCSNYALQTTANEAEQKYGSEVAEVLRRNFYVDDWLRSASTGSKAIDPIACLLQACRKGPFRLTMFICNRRSVLESIPVKERSKDVKTLDLSYDDLPIERALGVQQCVESDTFKFRITIKDKPVTRRGILSTTRGPL